MRVSDTVVPMTRRRSLLPLAVACLACIPGCSSSQKVEAPDAAILGEWRSTSSETAITFSPGGLYSLSLKGQRRPVMGGFSFDPKAGTLTLQTRRESPLCADDTGQYLVRIGSLSMDAELVRDTCEARAKVFATHFERPRGARPAAAGR